MELSSRGCLLYFRDNGYIVHEVGIGGNDGGVDLVIVDKRGEKTAVQAKCYADHNMVPVQTVRELVDEKESRLYVDVDCNHIDLIGPAKKEAEQFRMSMAWWGNRGEVKEMGEVDYFQKEKVSLLKHRNLPFFGAFCKRALLKSAGNLSDFRS